MYARAFLNVCTCLCLLNCMQAHAHVLDCPVSEFLFNPFTSDHASHTCCRYSTSATWRAVATYEAVWVSTIHSIVYLFPSFLAADWIFSLPPHVITSTNPSPSSRCLFCWRLPGKTWVAIFPSLLQMEPEKTDNEDRQTLHDITLLTHNARCTI